MPPKRVAENPPPSDEEASDEENDTVDDEEASDEENDTVAGKPNGAADDDDEEGEEDNSPGLKNSTVPASPQKSDLASDSDSESTQPSPSVFTIRHHKPSLKPNKSGSKRPNESDSVKEAPNKKMNKGSNDDKEAKKGNEAIKGLWKGREVDSGVKSEEMKREKKVEVKNHEKREEKGKEVEEFWTKYPFLGESLAMEGISDGVKVILKEQLDKIEKGKLEELERKWKRLRRAELELFVQRMELVQEIVKFTLDSIK